MTVVLKKHQRVVVDFMKKGDNFGLLLFHSTGSGKTITSLVAMNQFQKDIIIIGKKSSKKAFVDDLQKLKFDVSRYRFYTYKKMHNLLLVDDQFLKDKSVIVDEAHYLRNESKDKIFIIKGLLRAFKILFLSATPVLNFPNDVSVLINTIKKTSALPLDKDQFEFFYINKDTMEIENKKMLMDKLSNCVSYFRVVDTINYPKMETFIKEIHMDDRQITAYSFIVRRIIYESKDVPINLDINFEKLKKKQKNSFLSATRQLSNTTDERSDSLKMQEIFKMIKKGPYPIVIYSNYLSNGIFPLSKLLSEKNISYGKITGSTSDDEIINRVNNYNDGKYKVLLLSSAGSESLNLKKTRSLHIIEPYWNEAKMKQIIGRVNRYQSHIDLPPAQRNVKVYRWVSLFPHGMKYKTADQYLMELSAKKETVEKAFEKVMIEASIEKQQ
jgi:superfamily II DNA or RNA helicase